MNLRETDVTERMISDLAEFMDASSRDMYMILERIDEGAISTEEAVRIINRHVEILHLILTDSDRK